MCSWPSLAEMYSIVKAMDGSRGPVSLPHASLYLRKASTALIKSWFDILSTQLGQVLRCTTRSDDAELYGGSNESYIKHFQPT